MTQENPDNPPPLVNASSASPSPYEAVLIKAFERLTSEIFLFLLAYAVLVVVLSVFNVAMTDTLQNLLYLIPILGVITYTWVRQRSLARDAKKWEETPKDGVYVEVDQARGNADIGGIVGSHQEPTTNVGVVVKRASDHAKVRGIEYGQHNQTLPLADESYLVDLFQRLDDTRRRKLIGQAQKLLETQMEVND